MKIKLKRDNVEMLIEMIIALAIIGYFLFMNIKAMFVGQVCMTGLLGWLVIAICLSVIITVISDFKEQIKNIR